MRPAVGTGTTISRLAASRWLLIEWTRREVAVRYRQSTLGLAWVVVQPAALLLVYGVVVVRVLDVGMGGREYVLFTAAGLALWTFVSTALMRAAGSLSTAQALLGRVYFPREIVPLSTVLATLPDLVLTTALVLVLQMALGTGLHLSLLAAPLVVAGLLAFVAGVAVVLAAVSVFLRDIGHALPLALQLGFFATPIVYPSGRVPDDLRWAVDLNPLAHSLTAFREAVVLGTWPGLADLLGPLLLGGGLLLLSLRYFRAVEARLLDAL